MTEKHKKDYCGQAGDDWFSKLCSKLIPDNIYINGKEIYIGECCKEHDEDNTKNGANKKGDEKLKDCIRCKLRKALASKREILWHSNKYFVGVRFGNPFYKSSKELLKDLKKEFNRKKDYLKKFLEK